MGNAAYASSNFSWLLAESQRHVATNFTHIALFLHWELGRARHVHYVEEQLLAWFPLAWMETA